MRYSIIIPTYNHKEDLLKPCIESIYKYTDMSEVELIISANGCTDGTQEYVDSLNGAILIDSKDKLGYIKATNKGIKRAKGDFIVLLNNDTLLLKQRKSEWLSRLSEPFAKDSSIGITGVHKVNFKDTSKKFLIFFLAMIRKEVFQDIGYLSEEFNLGYCEDVDFCFRAEDRGYKVLDIDKSIMRDKNGKVGNFPIFHKGEGTFGDIEHKNNKDIEKSWDILYKKWEHKFCDNTVTAVVPTKDRYYTTLPLCLQAIAMQTRCPDKLVIYDDGECKNLLRDPLYAKIFKILEEKGVKWEVKFGKKIGQVASHQDSIDTCTTEYLWRVDDDNIPEPTVLERLLYNMRGKNIGAVAGLVINPLSKELPDVSGKIEDIYTKGNIQWNKIHNKDIIEVDHLYSTFLYRLSAAKHGYNKDLSPVGHREETLFTYGIKKAGYKVLVDTTIRTWHIESPSGGIRAESRKEMWEHDELVFKSKMKEYGIDMDFEYLVVLDNGIGDHFAFKNILPELKKLYNKINIAVCYPEVFEDVIDKNVKLISIEKAKNMCSSIVKYNIYKWMWDHNWEDSLVEATREMYLKEKICPY